MFSGLSKNIIEVLEISGFIVVGFIVFGVCFWGVCRCYRIRQRQIMESDIDEPFNAPNKLDEPVNYVIHNGRLHDTDSDESSFNSSDDCKDDKYSSKHKTLPIEIPKCPSSSSSIVTEPFSKIRDNYSSYTNYGSV